MKETLIELLMQKVAEAPEATCIKRPEGDTCKTWTLREFYENAERVRTLLEDLVPQAGAKLVLMLENRPEWGMVYFGALLAGLTCVPVDVNVSPAEVGRIVADCAATFIVCSDDILHKKINDAIRTAVTWVIVLDGALEKKERIITVPDITTLPRRQKPVSSVNADAIASIIYTSGTTSKPKGVMLTHHNFTANFRSINKLGIASTHDNFIALLPLHHTYPFMVTLVTPLLLGATITYVPKGFAPSQLGEFIKKTGVTILVGVPQLFSLLHTTLMQKVARIPALLRPLMRPLIKGRLRRTFGTQLRFFLSGGARLDPKVGADLARLGLCVVEGYGLSETAPVATFNQPRKVKFGSVGTPIPNVEVRINNPDAAGVGEVLIKGPNVMLGYYNRPDLTAEAIKDGWFYSGDLGYRDNDGFVFLTGRVKEVIVLSSGKNIYPAELEDIYQTSPFIKEICIVEKKEIREGKEWVTLYAVVVPDLEYFKERNVSTVHGTIRWELERIGKDLPPYQHIMGYVITKDALPRTALQKLKRYVVKDTFLEKLRPTEEQVGKPSREDVKLMAEPLTREILRFFERRFKRPVDLDLHWEIDLGIDSLSRVDVGLELERRFEVKFAEEDLFHIGTLRDTVTHIRALRHAQQQGQVLEEYHDEQPWHHILRELPQAELAQRIVTQPSLFDWWLTFVLKVFGLMVLKVMFFLRAERHKVLPSHGPYLITPNHASYLDGFVVAASLPMNVLMNTYFLIYRIFIDYPILRTLAKRLRLIAIDSSANFLDAMQATAFVLKRGKIVCIFPEGQRSIDGEIKEFKKGVGILMQELAIPALPTRIRGTYVAWPRGARLPHLQPVHVCFGQITSPSELLPHASLASPEAYGALVDLLRQRVTEL